MRQLSFISVIGYLFSLSMQIVLTITFFTAYINGGYVTIYINNLNEAAIEAILVPMVLIISLVGIVKMLKAL